MGKIFLAVLFLVIPVAGLVYYFSGVVWYITNEDLQSLLEVGSLEQVLGLDISWWHPPRVRLVSKVGLHHALVNLSSIFIVSATIIPAAIILAVMAVVVGISSCSLNGLLLAILGPIAAVLSLLLPVILWLVLLIQTADPIYYLIWGLPGLVAMLAGTVTPAAGIVIIVYR